MNDLSKKLLAFSRDQILQCLPSLSLALSDLPCLDADVSSLCFDGLRLYGNDSLVCRLFLDQALTRTLLHITIHRLFLHFLPQKTERSLWDLSSDIASEAFLDRLGLFPDGNEAERRAVYQDLSGRLTAFSAEAIYQLLKEQPPSFSPHLFARDDHRLWYPLALSQETSLGSGPSGGLSEEERLEALKKVKRILEPLSEELRHSKAHTGHGSSPGLQREQILLEKRGRYDFRRYLRRFSISREELHPDLDSFDYIPYYYGLMQKKRLAFLEPLETIHSSRIQDLVIAIDTSGSCSLAVVQEFLSETINILSRKEHFFDRMNVHLIQCDSMIQDHLVIHSKGEWEEKLKSLTINGRGGTDFTPVFTYVERLQKEGELIHLKGLLYFTDGDGIYPKKVPPYETAFVFLDERFLNFPVPDFIIPLCLHPESIKEEVLLYEH